MKRDVLSRAAFATAASVAVLVPLAGCSADPQQPPISSRPPSTPSSSPTPDDVSSSGAEYDDGVYTVKGVYGGAPSYMTITVVLNGDTITDVTVEPMPENNETSRGYQERFAAAVPGAVVGKSLDEAEVGKLAGASGCADGFNEAIAQIREQARITE